jgi:glycosyltransferase involved in cell wall biosynthesis
MRIAHVIDSGGMYGAESVVVSLAASLTRLGLPQVLVSIGDPGCEEKPIERAAKEAGIDVRAVRMRPGLNPLGSLRLLRTVGESGADIAHLHGYKPDLLFGGLPRRLRRIPVVATVHGMCYVGGFNRMAVYAWLDGCALKRMDAVVLVHQGIMGQIPKSLSRAGRVTVIQNGIAVDPSPRGSVPEPRAAVSDRGRRCVLGSLGRLSPEKGYDVLLRAAKRLVEKGQDVHVVIFGDGQDRRRLEELAASLGVADRLSMPGFVADARSRLASFDVFVLPSLTEGLPMSVLEAMEAGVPVVASAVGGLPDVLENGGAGGLAGPGDPESLATALDRVIGDRQLALALAVRASSRVRADYSASHMAEQYLALYGRVANART